MGPPAHLPTHIQISLSVFVGCGHGICSWHVQPTSRGVLRRYVRLLYLLVLEQQRYLNANHMSPLQSPFILHNFQSLILLVSCVPNFLSVVFLSTPASQRNADYPGRILYSLKLSAAAFTLLALSTLIWREAGPVTYLMFTLCMVFFSSLASGIMQNGAFSWVNRFSPINTQALMVGQSIAGVLPGIARMYSRCLRIIEGNLTHATRDHVYSASSHSRYE